VKVLDIAVRLQPRALRHVFGIGSRPNNSERHPIQPGLMASEELTERVRISHACATH
jgi:hypothetical protein